MNFTIVFAPRGADDQHPWLVIGFEPERCMLSSRWRTEDEVVEALRYLPPSHPVNEIVDLLSPTE